MMQASHPKAKLILQAWFVVPRMISVSSLSSQTPFHAERLLMRTSLNNFLFHAFSVSLGVLPVSAFTQPTSFAASFAKYVMIISAPARLMHVSDSRIVRSRSSQPLRCAATKAEYSPLT